MANGKSQIELNVDLGKSGLARFEVYIQDVKATQLFLSEINDKNIDEIPNIKPFKDAFEWFRENLKIIHPFSKLASLPLVVEDDNLKEVFCDLLKAFKTGIQTVETNELEMDSQIPTQFQENILNMFNKNRARTVDMRINGRSYSFSKNMDGAIKMVELHTLRLANNNDPLIVFNLEEESDGTRRIMDFIPVLVNLSHQPKTYIIDEIDRSLHPEISRNILEIFFLNTQNIESQLIVTTHESSLLDLDFLRRDEIWFVEKDNKGASTMYSLEQFKPRHDKEVRKAYLQGRFGAIPFMSNVKNLGWSKNFNKT